MRAIQFSPRAPARVGRLGRFLLIVLASSRAFAAAERVWESDCGTPDAEAVVFSRDLTLVAARLPSGNVLVQEVAGAGRWQWPTSKTTSEKPPARRRTVQPQVAFLPDGRHLMVAESKGLVIRDAQTGVEVRCLAPAPIKGDAYGSVQISPSGRCALAILDQAPVFWSLADGQLLTNLPAGRQANEAPTGVRIGPFARKPKPVPSSIPAGTAYAFAPGDVFFGVGLGYSTLDVWDLEEGHWLDSCTVSRLQSSSSLITGLTFLDEQRLAAVCNQEELVILTLRTNLTEIRQSLPRVRYLAMGPDGHPVQGELVGDSLNPVVLRLRQLGLQKIAIETKRPGPKSFGYATNANGTPIVGNVTAGNLEAALQRITTLGHTPTLVVEINVLNNEDFRGHGQAERPPIIVDEPTPLLRQPGLRIDCVSSSGDGRFLAAAGRRMAWRRGVFAPAGDGVFDVPLFGEAKVWDSIQGKLLTTLKGTIDERFARVSMDETGRRIGVVIERAPAGSTKPGQALQAGLGPASGSRALASVWDLPSVPESIKRGE